VSRLKIALVISVVLVVGALTAKAIWPRPGHSTEDRIEGAVHAIVVPFKRLSSGMNDQPGGKLFGRPAFQIAVSVGNSSDEYVVVGQCLATAYDVEGHALFQTGTLGIFGGLLHPNTPAVAPVGRDGAWYSGPSVTTKQNRDITRAEVKAVDRYETDCEAFRWVGPLPQPPDEEF
jgi:hypothetical protein